MSLLSHHKEAHHKPHHDNHTHTTTHHDHPRPFRLTRIVDCTISGQDLRIRETKMIANKLNFQPNEEIEIIYSKSDQFEAYFELHDQCLVGLTNVRIFKLEKGSITQSYLQDVVSVSHQKNGIFSWDKVDCKLRNGSCETFGIYEGKTCAFFVQHVQNHINKRPQGNGHHHHHHHDHCSPTSSTATIIYPNNGPSMIVPQPQVQPQYQPIPNGMQPQYQPIPNGMQPQYQPMYPQQQMYPAQQGGVMVQPGYGSAPPTNPPAYAPQ